MTQLDYDLATSANFLNAERLLNKEPQIAYCDALEIWSNLGPISITEVIERSGMDAQQFDKADIIF